MLFLFRSSPDTSSDQIPQQADNVSSLRLRWRHIALPLVIFGLTIALVAYFYRLLPEEVAYHFGSGSSPDEWTGRVTITLWTLLPQFLLTLLAAATAWGITKLSPNFKQLEGFRINLDTIAMAMGNMLALPQAIIFFAMLDIFSYNSYEIRILPLWVIALIIMALGAVIVGIFFIRSIRQVRDSQ